MHFISKHGKSYGTKVEFKLRLAEFKKTLKKIASHDEATAGHAVGLNHLSDYTDEEYKHLLGLKIPEGF